ncbi:hypothetical protein ABZ370_26610 [Streptomyces sp. NPDC005962]|uniref:hypothetical protein n=1 Tax=Streptomyces sp. NPDC005962 TaxID=3154466 RepID=UPI0033F30699
MAYHWHEKGAADHWHAYAWNGPERPPDSDRNDHGSSSPPLEISHWLRQRPEYVKATFKIPDDRDKARAWLQETLDEYPSREGPFSRHKVSELAYTSECLEADHDVVWGYYSESGRYVSRGLIFCPRAGECCPQPPGT